MGMRSTGGNKLTRSGKLETYGRTSDGQKTKIRTYGSKTDVYSGGRGKPDGAGHGHTVKRDGKVVYGRKAR
jgi:hypothetical protein